MHCANELYWLKPTYGAIEKYKKIAHASFNNAVRVDQKVFGSNYAYAYIRSGSGKDMKHLYEERSNVFIKRSQTKMATMPIYGKTPSKIFSGTGLPI